jgi:hypothetical protein
VTGGGFPPLGGLERKMEKQKIQWTVEPFTPVEWEQWHRLWGRILQEAKALEGGDAYRDKEVSKLNPNQ